MPTGRLPGRPEICTADSVPESQLAEFYRLIDPGLADYRAQHWRWQYRVGSNENVSPLLAMIDGSIAGHAGLIPVTLRRGDEERAAIWFVDFWVRPDLQRQGVGIALTEVWMALCPLQITFCNEKSLGVFLKFGWVTGGATHSYRLLLRPERHPGVRGRGLGPLAQLAGASLRALWKVRTSASADLSVTTATADQLPACFEREHGRALHVPRTPDFLRWRVLESPSADSYLVLRLPGRESPCAIARLLNREDYRRLNLLAIASDPAEPQALSKLFASILRWADNEGVDDVVYVTSDPEHARIARRWLPIRASLLYASHANDAEGAKFLAEPGHFWESIDSDIDLALI